MFNFTKYFDKQCKIFLKEITFEQSNISANVMSIKFCDDLSTYIKENSLHVIFKRSVKMEPEATYKLSVSYELELTFNSIYVKEIEPNAINFEDELIRSGQNILSLLISRAVLLIAQITSSGNNNPVITPPHFINGKG